MWKSLSLVLAFALLAACAKEKRREPTRLDMRPPDKQPVAKAPPADPSGLTLRQIVELPQSEGVAPPANAAPFGVPEQPSANQEDALTATLALLPPGPLLVVTTPATPFASLELLARAAGKSERHDLWLATRTSDQRITALPFCVARDAGACHGTPFEATGTKRLTMTLTAGSAANVDVGEPGRPPITLEAITPAAVGAVLSASAGEAGVVIFDLAGDDGATVASALPALVLGAQPTRPQLRFTIGRSAAAPAGKDGGVAPPPPTTPAAP